MYRWLVDCSNYLAAVTEFAHTCELIMTCLMSMLGTERGLCVAHRQFNPSVRAAPSMYRPVAEVHMQLRA